VPTVSAPQRRAVMSAGRTAEKNVWHSVARQERGRDSVMPFSENVKLQIRRMTGFQCCRCHVIGVDIHHIIPQAQGGSDDIDNAAPLCPNCHDWFGANPEKRKHIREMRDWWYEVIEQMYPTGGQSQFEKLDETLLKIQHAGKAELDELRKELIQEIRAVRTIQDQAEESLKYVAVTDIPRQANTAIFGTMTVMGMPETLRQAAEKGSKPDRPDVTSGSGDFYKPDPQEGPKSEPVTKSK
jgi:5-methylcytosine-specific restriction endonuclease McrA